MNIPFVDLKIQYENIKDEIDKAIRDIVDNAAFIMGEPVNKFEEEFAAFCNRKHAIGVSSGTSALFLALKANNIKEKDEVITVPNTFIATTETIVNIGAKIKFVEVDPKTYTIDPNKIEEAITEKTKAILPVHLYGQPSDMTPIKEIAVKHDLKIIEDCAQAHGTEYKNTKTPMEDTGCFSFYPGKNLGAYGDAGAVVTDDEEVAEKIVMLRNHGRKKGDKYVHRMNAYNERIDAIQAAILRVKLKHLDKWTEQRRDNARLYNELLSEKVITPFEPDYAKHVYHLYVIRTKKRDELQKHLKENGISTGVHYPIPLNQQEAYKDMNFESFPLTEELSTTSLSLPMFPELTEEQINFIAEKINEFVN